MQDLSIKSRLILGFSTMLLLIVVLAAVGLASMWAMETRLRVVVEEHYAKVEFMVAMRKAVSARTVSLFRMLLAGNNDQRQQEQASFQRYLLEFKRARTALLDMPLTPAEREVLSAKHDISQDAVDLQGKVASLLRQDQMTLAGQVMYKEVIPIQEQAMSKLEDLIYLQRAAGQSSRQEAKQAFAEASTLIMLLGGAAILVGLLVALIVVRRTSESETQLFREMERAQVTLHSIGEGVITTNAAGKVDYLNAVAEQLTGYTNATASGLLLTEVFAVVSELEQELLPDNFLDPVVTEKQTLENPLPVFLCRQDGRRFAIEYTVAPICDYDDTVSGTVVVFRDVSAIREMIEQMTYQAKHDSLTGLINRREFERLLVNAIDSARHQQAEHVFCYIDLDQFKVINDNCGHVAGDEFLKQLSQLLLKNVRRTDVLARLGGDEFGILLQNCRLNKAVQVVDELREAMNGYRFIWADKSFEISASFGIVNINEASGGITEVLSAADTACFVAKDLGRNRAYVYQPDDIELAKRRNEMQWLPRIRAAIQTNQFQLYQQRIIALKNSELAFHFYEILVRIVDGSGKVIPPKAFIPAAERYDLMPVIDRWVVEHAFDYISRFCVLFPQKSCMWTINLSGHTLCDKTFYEFVLQLATRLALTPSKVCFEVTETAAVANLSSAGTMICKLREHGFRFALDDFGSGLSSFTYLKKLPVDFLKIDGSFVKDMAIDPIDRAMVTSIHQISQVMGLNTIAEYVEDANALQCLKDIGVEYAQGFWLHEPEPLLPLLTPLANAQP